MCRNRNATFVGIYKSDFESFDVDLFNIFPTSNHTLFVME
jgi:hypothetical protein